MRIAIVDDEEKYLDKIEESVSGFFREKQESAEISRYSSARALLTALEEGDDYDVYFLDVEMEEMGGLELARKIHGFRKNAKIILVTSFPKYMMDGYRIHAYYFVLKSDCRAGIREVLEMLRNEEQAEREEAGKGCYIIQNNHHTRRIPFDKIVWITKEKKYIVFGCISEGEGEDGLQEYRERSTLEQVYSQLPSKEFIYIHRGCIINMAYVYSQKRLEIVLKAGKKEYVRDISQRLSPQVKQALMEYWKNQ